MPIMARNIDGEYVKVTSIVLPDGTYINRVYDKDGDLVYTSYSEIIGAPPIEFETSGNYLTDYRISGNTIQNGEPSPDNPVEVVGCGERTENLWSIDKAVNDSANSYVYKVGDELRFVTSGNGGIVYNIDENKNTQYTFFTLLRSATSSSNNINFIAEYDDNTSSAYSFRTTDTAIHSFLFTTENKNLKRLRTNNTNARITYLKNTMLVPGSTPPDHYIPYGYKIPVTISGKNLLSDKFLRDLSADGLTWTINEDRTISVSGIPTGSTGLGFNRGNYIHLADIGLKSGDNVATRIIGQTSNIVIQIAFYNENNETRYVYDSQISYAFAIPDDVVKFRLWVKRRSNGIKCSGTFVVQLEKGAAPTDYEPYHEPITTPVYIGSEPLHKIGEYADYVDYARGVVVRRIKKLVLTGDENILLINDSVFNIYANHLARIIPVSTHYISKFYSSWDLIKNLEIATAANNVTFCRIKDTRFSTLEDFKSYLAEQYEVGTPVTIWYVLAEPEEEPLENLLPIQTIKGTNILTVDTEVQPSEMYIKYRR